MKSPTWTPAPGSGEPALSRWPWGSSKSNCARSDASRALWGRTAAIVAIAAIGFLAGSGGARASTTTDTGRRPTTSSMRHEVVKGENLYRIALSYGVTVADLCRANGINDQSQVTVGRVLFVPATRGSKRSSAATVPERRGSSAARTAGSLSRKSAPSSLTKPSTRAGDARTPVLRTSARRPSLPKQASPSRADITSGVIDNDQLEYLIRPAAARDEDEDETAGAAETDEFPAGEGGPKGISFNLIPSEEPFSWPVQGGIVRSPFGRRHGRQHAGIDICAPSGSPIYAARDGIVSYSGHKFRGYGNVVMVDHHDGFTTIYAHNTANLVHEGDQVVRGQMIARVGATGNATGSHCHFEIRNDNVSVDPRGYLSENPDEDVIFAAGGPTQVMMP